MADLQILIEMLKSGTGASDAAGELREIEEQAKKTESGLGSIGMGMMKVGTAMTMLTAPVLTFAGQAAQAATAAKDEFQKMERVFGDSAETIETFSATSARSVGLASSAAAGAASQFGTLFTTLGVGKQPAADMSVALVKLAADISQFENISMAQAIEMLQSGLTGRAQGLKRLGVDLSEAAVNTKAVAMGLAETTAEVDASSAAQARYQLILEQTKLQQGEWARSIGETAVNQQISAAEMQTSMERMGEALVPLLENLTGKVADVATAFNNLNPELQNTVVTAGLVVAALGPVISALGAVVSAASSLGPIITALTGLSAAVLGTSSAVAAGTAAIVAGLAMLSNEATSRTLTDEEAAAILGVPNRAQLEAQLQNLETFKGVLLRNIEADPNDPQKLVDLTGVLKQIDEVKAALNSLGTAEGGAAKGGERVQQLEEKLASLREETQRLVAETETNPFAMIDLSETLREIDLLETELANLTIVSEGAVGPLHDVSNAALGIGMTTTQAEALQTALTRLEVGKNAAEVNAVAMAIFRGQITLAQVEALGLEEVLRRIQLLGDRPLVASSTRAREHVGITELMDPGSRALPDPSPLPGSRAWNEQQEAARRRQEFLRQQAAAERALETAKNKAQRDQQAAIERAADQIEDRFMALANTITRAIEDARAKAKGLFDLTGGGLSTEPGKNGPFEALYRILDVAATEMGRAPGADTEKWREMYAGSDFVGISRAFQSGNLLAPGVFENIDWQALGQSSLEAQTNQNLSQYAGQAAAALISEGKEITPEAIRAIVEELAAQDKAGIIPNLETIQTILAQTDETQHSDLGNLVKAVESVEGAVRDVLGSDGNGEETLPSGAVVPPSTGSVPSGEGRVPALAPGRSPGGPIGATGASPELVPLDQPLRPGGGMVPAAGAGGGTEFVAELAKQVGLKSSTPDGAAAELAEMLTHAAAANVQAAMLKQFTRRAVA